MMKMKKYVAVCLQFKGFVYPLKFGKLNFQGKCG